MRLFLLSIIFLFTAACGGGIDGASSAPTEPSGPYESSIFESLEVGPGGGEFELDNGIMLSVPSGAVPEATTFGFRLLKPEDILLPENLLRTFDRKVIWAIEARPSGYLFERPISLRIKNTPYPLDSLPYVLLLDKFVSRMQVSGSNSLVMPSPTTSIHGASDTSLKDLLLAWGWWGIIVFHPENNTIEFPNVTQLPPEKQQVALLAIDRILEHSDCIKQPCRCMGFEIRESQHDSEVGGEDGCYSTYVAGAVIYPNCPPGPLIEPWELAEADKFVFVSPGSATIDVGETQTYMVGMQDLDSQPVVEFDLTSFVVEQPAVINVLRGGGHLLTAQGISPGDSSVKVATHSDGCEYQGWFSANVRRDERSIAGVWRLQPKEGLWEECRYMNDLGGGSGWSDWDFWGGSNQSFDARISDADRGEIVATYVGLGKDGPQLKGNWIPETLEFDLSVYTSDITKCGNYVFDNDELCGEYSETCSLQSCQLSYTIDGRTQEDIDTLDAESSWEHKIGVSYYDSKAYSSWVNAQWECRGRASYSGERLQ